MKPTRRGFLAGLGGIALLAGGAWWWQLDRLHYLDGQTVEFVQAFAAPPDPGSPETRRELDELLELQRTRTPELVAEARADRKTDISRFYPALGDHNYDHWMVRRLAQRTEDDVRIYVRAAKDHFRRLRPSEIEPRLEPCIEDVQGDLSYPSGHATFAFSMAYLLGSIVPERARDLEQRAEEFARQRMVCGVHFRSDIEAGRMAAQWLMVRLRAEPRFRSELEETTRAFRAAVKLPNPRPRD